MATTTITVTQECLNQNNDFFDSTNFDTHGHSSVEDVELVSLVYFDCDASDASEVIKELTEKLIPYELLITGIDDGGSDSIFQSMRLDAKGEPITINRSDSISDLNLFESLDNKLKHLNLVELKEYLKELIQSNHQSWLPVEIGLTVRLGKLTEDYDIYSEVHQPVKDFKEARKVWLSFCSEQSFNRYTIGGEIMKGDDVIAVLATNGKCFKPSDNGNEYYIRFPSDIKIEI
ncbi:hypothetical protein EIJ81_00260 (plasmid) [Aliivibrio salmonicida]|uniref:hypothetical protein n=1 Tax=Aliivibrio salmonicida TaxID=40269 RepID=UPI000F6C5A74|nr:hypothetical protein [Aliivibrio salmonicida]AZL83335.1 hypothetical protein EIJ81_00260 [Aliivibrio salmonicida]